MLVFCGAVSAADLPTEKAQIFAPPPPPAFSWTGFYAGVSGGYSVDHASYPFIVRDDPAFVSARSGLTERGGSVGLQVGYNYQLAVATRRRSFGTRHRGQRRLGGN